jgi:hypothetical protein
MDGGKVLHERLDLMDERTQSPFTAETQRTQRIRREEKILKQRRKVEEEAVEKTLSSSSSLCEFSACAASLR